MYVYMHDCSRVACSVVIFLTQSGRACCAHRMGAIAVPQARRLGWGGRAVEGSITGNPNPHEAPRAPEGGPCGDTPASCLAPAGPASSSSLQPLSSPARAYPGQVLPPIMLQKKVGWGVRKGLVLGFGNLGQVGVFLLVTRLGASWVVGRGR